MTNPTGMEGLQARFFQIGLVHRIEAWLHKMPHPGIAVEISGQHVAAARWGKIRGHLDDVAVQVLPAGAVMPSPVETNVTQPDGVRSALRQVFNTVPVSGAHVALLVPDPCVRVFILPFDNLPRRAADALPLLRWRLKKSVPFDVEETVVSWMRQEGRHGSLEIVASVARQTIIREYEELVESLGAHPSVVLSSTLATLPLLEDDGATLLVRLCGKMLTTVIVRGNGLCVYRSSEMRADAASLEPQAVLDEVFPALAYYQDSWNATVDRARLTGFGAREELFAQALSAEAGVAVGSMSATQGASRLDRAAKDLLPHGLDALAGWAMNGAA